MKCSICNKEILVKGGGWDSGNNAQPVNDGRCCDECNMAVVVPARLRITAMRKDNPWETITKAMEVAGLHPSLIHAFTKTGLLVGEDSPHTPAERREWIEAVNEWYDMHPEAEESDA